MPPHSEPGPESQNIPRSETIHLPDGVHYNCQMCGDCCRGSWEIQVEPEAAERILGLDWRSCSKLPNDAKSPFVHSKSRSRSLLFRRVGAACSFQGDRNQCRLHEKFGYAVKPHVCRRFPFRFIDTPGGVYVGFSFACKSVIENIGAPAAESREEAVWIYEHAPERELIREPILLDHQTPVDWESYQAVERGLDAILSREDRPVSLCLVAGHVWLGTLHRMLETLIYEEREKRGKNPPDAEEETAIRKKGLLHYVGRTSQDGFQRAFDAASRPVANRPLKRMVLGTFISFRGSIRPRQWRISALTRVVFENIRHLARVGRLRLDPLEKSVPYRRFSPRPDALSDPETQILLRRWFRHCLFRKDLIAHTDLFWGYCYLLLCHGLIEYYEAVLEATGEGNPAKALGLVERQYVHHSGFNQTFLYHPAIAHVFQYLFRKPNFGHTMVA